MKGRKWTSQSVDRLEMDCQRGGGGGSWARDRDGKAGVG